MESSKKNEKNVSSVRVLSKGLLELYEPPLTTINTHLKELTEKQEAVHSMIVLEKHKMEDIQNDAMLDALLADIATNRERLVTLSNSMMVLHRRVQALQVRTANIEKAARSRAAEQNKPADT